MYQKPRVERFGTLPELSRSVSESEGKNPIQPSLLMVLRIVKERLDRHEPGAQDRHG